MGYAMSSKSIISQPSVELFNYWTGDDYYWNLGTSDDLIFQTYINVTKLNITDIKVYQIGKKAADVGADNHMKLTVDGNLAVDTVYTNAADKITYTNYALSTHSVTGYVPVKFRYDAGGDDSQYMKLIKIWTWRNG